MENNTIKNLVEEKNTLINEKESILKKQKDNARTVIDDCKNNMEKIKSDIYGSYSKIKAINIADYFIYFIVTFCAFPYFFSTLLGVGYKFRHLITADGKPILRFTKKALEERLDIPYIGIFVKNARSYLKGDYNLRLALSLILAMFLIAVIVILLYVLIYRLPTKSKDDLDYGKMYNLCLKYVLLPSNNISPAKCHKKANAILFKIFTLLLSFVLYYFATGTEKVNIFISVFIWLIIILILLLYLRLLKTILMAILFRKDKKAIKELDGKYIEYRKTIEEKEKYLKNFEKENKAVIKKFDSKIADIDKKIKTEQELEELPKILEKCQKTRDEMMERFGGDKEKIIKYAKTDEELYVMFELFWEDYKEKYINTKGNTDYDIQYDYLKLLQDFLIDARNYLPVKYYHEKDKILKEARNVEKYISTEKRKEVNKKTAQQEYESKKQMAIKQGNKLNEYITNYILTNDEDSLDNKKIQGTHLEAARLGNESSYDTLKNFCRELRYFNESDWNDYYNKYYDDKYITITDISCFFTSNKSKHKDSISNAGNAYGLNETNANATGSIYNMRPPEYSFSNIPDLNTSPSDYPSLSTALDGKVPSCIKNDPLMEGKVVHPDGSIHIDVSDM